MDILSLFQPFWESHQTVVNISGTFSITFSGNEIAIVIRRD